MPPTSPKLAAMPSADCGGVRFPPLRAVDAAVVLLLAVVAGAVLYRQALLIYDPYDMPAFMDAGYRVAIGQKPYADFLYTVGPVHLYFHALAYRLLGFNKWAILGQIWSVNTILIAMLYAIARTGLSRPLSGLLALLGAAAFYLPVAHPWYDQHAAFFVVGGVFVLEIVRRCRIRAVRRLLIAVIGGCLALACLTKHSIGVPAGLVLLGGVWLAGDRWDGLLAYLAGGAVTGLAILAAIGDVANFVDQVILQYQPWARVLWFSRIGRVLLCQPATYLVPAAAVAAAMAGRAAVRKTRVELWIFGGLTGVALLAAYTSSTPIGGNLPFVGPCFVYLCLFLVRLENGASPTVARRLERLRRVVVAAGVLCLFVICLVNRKPYVWAWRGSNRHCTESFKTPALRGWHYNPELLGGLDEVVAYVRDRVPPHDSLLVFPDVTVIYGLTGRESRRGMPFLFHAGIWPAPGSMATAVRNRLMFDPAEWIVMHRQTEIMRHNAAVILDLLGLTTFVHTNYEVVERFGTFSVLHRRTPVSQ